MVSEIKNVIRKDFPFQAVITTPSGFDPKKESLPMMVFLHGAGERGDDLNLVKVHGIPKYFSADPDYLGLRVITVSPQCPSYTVWNDISLPLFDFITETAKAYNADTNRIAITGISMGGFGTWELVVSNPDFFAAAAPICGGGMDWRVPHDLATPIRAFHGGIDGTVPCVYSQKMCDAVNARGGNAVLTIFPNCDHDSWSPAYETTDIIKWLASTVR